MRSRLSRRQLLQSVGGVVLASSVPRSIHADWPVASRNIRWAAGWLLWRDFKGRKIALAEALRDVQQSGADGIEFTPRPGELDSLGLTIDAVKGMLRDHGLAVSGHYFSGPFLDAARQGEILAQAREKCDALKAFGARHLVVGPPPSPPAGVNRLEAIARIVPLVNEIGRRGAAEGIRVGLHPHLNTLIETPEETDRFLELSDPAHVGLALDTGHFHLAGGDVLAVLQKHGARLNYLHFKDVVGPFRRPDFFPNLRELGRGEVDFPGVMRALQRLRYSGWIDVEQDFTVKTPKESCETSMKYVRDVLDKIYA